MVFRAVANIDPDYNKGLILSDAADNTEMVWTGATLTNSQPAHVAIVDGSGDQITSFGGGTQYAEGATPSPGTGTLALGRYYSSPPTVPDGALYALQLDVNGALKVSGAGGGTQYTSNIAPPDPIIGNALMVVDSGAWQAVSAGNFNMPAKLYDSTGAIAIGDARPLQVGPGTIENINFTFDDATPLNTTSNLITYPDYRWSTVIVQVSPNASVAGGAITFEGSIDGSTYNPINVQKLSGETGQYQTNGTSITMVASTPVIYQIAIGGVLNVRVRLSTIITGGGGEVDFAASLTTSAHFGPTDDGGGIQYNQGDMSADPTGTAMVYFDGSDLAVAVTTGSPLPVVQSTTMQVNLEGVNGTATSVGNGIADAGTQRVAIATNIDTIGGITLAGTDAQWKDDANYGENVTSGVGTVHPRLWDGAAYDRWPGDSTDGALVNLGANNDVTFATPTTLVAFVTDIPTAGTRVQLASNAVSGIVVTAAAGNTGLIFVGGSLVSSTVYGMQLQPGQSIGIAIDNTNKVWVDTATNGNDVAVIGS